MDLELGFRFAVTFFAGGVLPNPIDTRFRRVSGLEAEVRTTTLAEGGQNLYAHRLPERIEHANLVLERGLVLRSPLALEFEATLTAFRFAPSNVLVALLGQDAQPRAAWMFVRAYPIKWTTADLDAGEETIVIDTMELAYARMQTMRV